MSKKNSRTRPSLINNNNKNNNTNPQQQNPNNNSIGLQLRPSKQQRNNVPNEKRNMFHIKDAIELNGDGTIMASFQEQLVPVGQVPDWAEPAEEFIVKVIRKKGLFFYALDFVDNILPEEKKSDNNFEPAIPPSPPNTFTKGDQDFPPIIARNKDTLKLSQYLTPDPINNRRFKQSKPKKPQPIQSEEKLNKKDINDRINNIKKTGACVDYDLKNGKFCDKRIDGIDLEAAAADLDEFKLTWCAINDCKISKVEITANSLYVYSRVSKFQDLINGTYPDYDAAISILYKYTKMSHPMHRLKIHELIPSTEIIKQKSILRLTPISGSRTESILMDLDWSAPFPMYQHNEIQIEYVGKNLQWSPVNMCMMNVPPALLQNGSFGRIINDQILRKINITCLLYVVINAMKNNYDVRRINFKLLMVQLIKPYDIKLERMHAIKAELNKLRSVASPMDEDRSNSPSIESVNSEFDEDVWYDRKVNEAERKFAEMMQLIEKSMVTKDHIIDLNKITVRRFCFATLYHLSNETGSDLPIPSWLASEGWFKMVRLIAAENCVQSVSRSQRTDLLFEGNPVYFTPMTLTGINPKLIVGDESLGFPMMKFRTGTITKYVLLLRADFYIEYIATAPSCVCGKKFPGHHKCPEQARFMAKAINTIRQKYQNGKCTKQQMDEKLKKIVSVKCIKCGHWGHFANECKNGSKLSCVACYRSKHMRSLSPFVCDDTRILRDLFRNLYDLVMNFKNVELNNVSHHKLINCTVSESLALKEIYKVIKSDAANQRIELNANKSNKNNGNKNDSSYSEAAGSNNDDIGNVISDQPQNNNSPNIPQLFTSNALLDSHGLNDADFECEAEDSIEILENKEEAAPSNAITPNGMNLNINIDPHLNPFINKPQQYAATQPVPPSITNSNGNNKNNPNQPTTTNIDQMNEIQNYSFDLAPIQMKSSKDKPRKPQPKQPLSVPLKLPRFIHPRKSKHKSSNRRQINNRLTRESAERKRVNVLPFTNARGNGQRQTKTNKVPRPPTSTNDKSEV